LESQLNSRQATGEEIGTHRETVSEEKEKKDSEAETPEKKEEEQNPEQGKEQERATPIDPVIVCYASNPHEWEKDLIYMYPVAMSMALDNGSGKHRKGDEDLPDNKKKKKRNKGLSY